MRRLTLSLSQILKAVFVVASITLIVVASKAQHSSGTAPELDNQLLIPLASKSAYIPTPTPTPTVVSRLGVQVDGSDSANMNLAASTGAKWTRVTIVWSQIERSQGSYSFAGTDSLLASVAGSGLTPIVEIRGNPDWAATTACGPVDKTGGLNAFGSFIQALVGRYSQAPYNVKHWEMYNEADNRNVGLGDYIGGCWGDYPAQYVAVLQTARGAVDSVDAGAKIVLGGLARDVYPSETDNWFNLNFPGQVLDAGGGAYIDIMNIHYFSTQGPSWSSYGRDIAGKVGALRQTMHGRGVDKPVIVTELSWTNPSQDPEVFAEMQARYLPKAFARGLAIDLYAMTWFLLQEWQGADIAYGLVDLSGQPRPAYYAFQTAATEFGQAAFVRAMISSDVSASGGVEGYAFDYGGEERWVLWAEDSDVTISLPERAIAAKNKLGQAIPLTGGGASTSIQLTGSPIFVRLNRS